ncbi:MAG: hypothetical protein HY744_25320 [Deltaproteobacteria bacterium]|nr:hypothetical protein [Deltaproteobacteria bacterium]
MPLLPSALHPTRLLEQLHRHPLQTYAAKRLVAGTALVALGVAFEMLSEHSAEMRREIGDWEEGRTFALGVLPEGPSIAVRKQGGRLVYLGRGDHEAPLRILFKNIDSALLVLTGLLAAHTAFAERRAVVHGAIDDVMAANRAMAVVVKFLFPGFMLGSLTKRVPVFSRDELKLKARLYATIGPALVRGFSR